MKRYSIHGDQYQSSIQTSRCAECGMGTIDANEFHPWEACEEFKRTHDSREVWKAIMPLFRERILKVPA